jgi:hypothetical protein
MVRQLCSEDPGAWHEALFRLASAGPSVLAQLDVPSLLADDRKRGRIRLALTLALLRSVPPASLRGHPRLRALVSEDISRGYELAASFEHREELDGEGAGDNPLELFLPDAPDSAAAPPDSLSLLLELRGAAVPGCLSLLRSPRPVARAYGCTLLSDLSATAVLDSLRPLFLDGAGISVSHGDYEEAKRVTDVAQASHGQLHASLFGPSRFWEPLNMLGDWSDVVNAINETSGAMKARSWDEWWNDARPSWSDWWRFGGPEMPSSNFDPWKNSIRAYEGFQLYDPVNGRGSGPLTISGPNGTTVVVTAIGAMGDSTCLFRGALPDTIALPQDCTVAIRAVLPDKRQWQETFLRLAGCHLELLSHLRQHPK